jgi:hypothetical protein
MSNLVNNLNSLSFWMNRYIPPLLIVFGTFGNVLNLIIFTRRTLRINPCSMYFLAGSINNLFAVYVAILSRYLSISWNLDITNTNTVLCKLRLLFVYVSLTLVLWFTILASIDRFFSSSKSVRLRQLSSLPVARKNVVLMTLFMYLIFSHVLIFGKPVLSGSTSSCIFYSNAYNIFFSFFFLIVASILPLVLMCVFGILIIRNVRSVHNRVVTKINDARTERMRSSDRQLFIMLLFQLLITALLTTPYATLSVYNTITGTILNYKWSTFDHAILNFLVNTTRLLSYSNAIVGFYIYTLSGPKFRSEVKRCIQYVFKSTLIVMGLTRCLPQRAQRAVAGETEMEIQHEPVTRGTRNTVHPIQHRTTMNKTSAL